MSGRGLASLAAIAAILVAGPSAASGQEQGEVPPVFLPQGVGERIPDLRERHPWVYDDAPFPLYYSYVRGRWKWPNGSEAFVYCLLAVTSDNPNWRQEDMRYMRYNGGARCNYQMGSITGITRLHNYDLDETKHYVLAEAPYGAQHEVPAGQGEGWQAYGMGTYTRTSNDQFQTIRTHMTLELPAQPGAYWDEWGGNPCQRDATNFRIIRCRVDSPPFQHVPNPCPDGKAGLQPPGCIAVPSRPECSGPAYPGDNPEYQCPEDDDLPGRWGPEDGFYADLEDERQGLEEDTGQTVPGGPLPNASTASGNGNNNSDPHFEGNTRCVVEPDTCFWAVEWCNDGYRVRRRWCYSKYTFSRRRNPDWRLNITGSKLRGTNSKAVYVCAQMAKSPVYSGKAFETCNTNIAKTGYHRPPRPIGQQYHGECEHFHVKKQWVWCNWHKIYE